MKTTGPQTQYDAPWKQKIESPTPVNKSGPLHLSLNHSAHPLTTHARTRRHLQGHSIQHHGASATARTQI
jgi:hypothetical protein